MTDEERVCDFIEEHFTLDIIKYLTADLPETVAWYIQSRLCGIAEEAGQIVAIVMGRPVSSVEEGFKNRHVAQWRGKTLWVDCVVSRKGMNGVWRHAMEFLSRHGCKFEQVAWLRPKRNAKLLVFPFDRINEKMQGAAWG